MMSKITIKNKYTSIEQQIVVETVQMSTGINDGGRGSYGPYEEKIVITFHQRDILGDDRFDYHKEHLDVGAFRRELDEARCTITLVFYAMTYDHVSTEYDELIKLIGSNALEVVVDDSLPEEWSRGDIHQDSRSKFFRHFDIKDKSVKYIRELHLDFRYPVEIRS